MRLWIVTAQACREPANGTAHKLAISKSQLPALLQRAHAAKEALGAARDAEGNQLVAALRDGQQVQHDLSVWLADARTVLEAETSDNFFFKVVNLPRWPIGRFKAWLSRNKVTVKVCVILLGVQQQASEGPLFHNPRHTLATAQQVKCTVHAGVPHDAAACSPGHDPLWQEQSR